MQLFSIIFIFFQTRIVACDTSHSSRKLYVNAHSLKVAWTVSSRVSKDDWLEWLRPFSIGLITESPSPALRFVFLCTLPDSPQGYESQNFALINFSYNVDKE